MKKVGGGGGVERKLKMGGELSDKLAITDICNITTDCGAGGGWRVCCCWIAIQY